MRIVEPSATIIEDELSQLSIYQRIAYCAGVCYQREPNKTEEEAQAFCRKMLKVKHMSTMEMAVVHLVMPHWYIPESEKYFQVKRVEGSNGYYVVSGSIRAFIEADAVFQLQHFLAAQYPIFFGDFGEVDSGVRFALPEEIPWQHKHVSARFIVNRAVSHELVRHRPVSFLQESQRYCRYDDEVVFIRPEWGTPQDTAMSMQEAIWVDSVKRSENAYRNLLQNGLKPQQARAVLPNSTKTELIAYASLPQWRHMFDLRCSPAADPEMRRIMIPLEQEFKSKYPEAWTE